MPQDIPWGYGHDRVTAMVVDPMRLYVYWEVTDDRDRRRARAASGPAGERAWLNLRVYDITGRLFDGTNAHSYFDHRVERHERQWFFVIDKPTSTACVEIGLRSEEGYFVKIARSGRVDFPAPRAGRRRRRRVAERARRDRSGRRPLVRRAGGTRRRAGPRSGTGAAAGRGPGGGGAERDARQRVGGVDGARRLPGPARPAPVRAHAGSARKASPAPVDQRAGRRPNGSARCCAPSGSRARSRIPSTFPTGSIEVQDNGEVAVRLGRRPHARHVRAVAGRDPRHRRARRAARARRPGSTGADRGRGRRRARRRPAAAATRRAARSGWRWARASGPGWARASCSGAAPASCGCWARAR